VIFAIFVRILKKGKAVMSDQIRIFQCQSNDRDGSPTNGLAEVQRLANEWLGKNPSVKVVSIQLVIDCVDYHVMVHYRTTPDKKKSK
jgi:hypothetical protein